MERERYGTRYEKTCPICSGVFGTDSKVVKYCSQSCYRKADLQKNREYLRDYSKTQRAKEKRREYNRRMYLKKKEAELASNIAGYFNVLHEKVVNPRVLSHKSKRRK
jgi:hypothetical protein